MEPTEPINIHVEDQEPKDNEIEIEVLGTPLSAIEPIQRTRGIQVNSIEDPKEIVEPPLLKAAEILYSKAIPTYESSANKTHLQWDMDVGIGIIVDKLSPANLEILNQLTQGNSETRGYSVTVVDSSSYSPYQRIAYFQMKPREDLTVEEIEEKSVDFANHFILNDLIIEPNETINIDV